MQARRQNLEAAKEWRKALTYAPNDERLREELLSALYRAKDPAALKLADELLRLKNVQGGLEALRDLEPARPDKKEKLEKDKPKTKEKTVKEK